MDTRDRRQVNFLWPSEFVERLDRQRGQTARATFVRTAVEIALDQGKKASSEPSKRTPAENAGEVAHGADSPQERVERAQKAAPVLPARTFNPQPKGK